MKASALFDLTGEVALVTGASSGLGKRFAQVLAANGAKVVCVARRKDRLAQLVTEIGPNAIAVEADVVSRDAMARAFDAAEAAFGTVTLLVNNAGIAHTARAIDGPAEEIWRQTMAVNLDAVYFVAQLAAQRMAAAGKPGSIINIASILGFGAGRGVAAYAVSKAGVVQLTRALGLEFARLGIRVNAIAPGYFITEINEDFLTTKGAAMAKDIPMGRFGKEGELDGVLLLLASKAGSYINGVTYAVDGGHLAGLKGL